MNPTFTQSKMMAEQAKQQKLMQNQGNPFMMDDDEDDDFSSDPFLKSFLHNLEK